MKLYTTILFCLLVTACRPAGLKIGAGEQKEYLVSADAKGKVTADDLKEEYRQFAAFIKNGYTGYRITYRTKAPDGADVIASGAIFVPDIKAPLPILNYNHGTYFPSNERQAPSYFNNSYEVVMSKMLASNGYLVVMPDYVGYGNTKNIKHPYGAYHVIAASVVDMLRAAREFCVKNKIELSGKNFFSGWSEGAAVGLATVKLLEEKHKDEFKPTATVLNAGPYYSSQFVHHILDSDEPLRHMNTYVWILQSYNRIYNINKPMSYYFNEPAATELERGPETRINRDPKELFTETFRNNYKAGRDTALENALVRNDLWDWKPESKVVFCHGDNDDYVPLFNSEKAYEAMKAKGADVSLQVFKGQNHSSGIFQYVMMAFGTFEKLR